MSQLQGKKGVKLSGFGVFTLTPNMQPAFQATNDFMSQFKLRQSSTAIASNIPTMLLNFAYLAQECDMERERAEKIYNKFISCLSRSVGEGRMISLSINKVAEIRIGRGELVCDFMREFLDGFNVVNTSIRPNIKAAASKTMTQLRATSRPRSASNQITMPASSSRAMTPTLNRRNSTAGSLTLTSSNLNRLQHNTFDTIQPREVAARAMNNSSTSNIIERVRGKIVERGGSGGIRTITRLLMIMDDNGDKKLSKEELKYGLKDYGIDLSPSELEQVFQYFDRDRNGFIDITEFLVGLRGEMNPRRKSFIRMAFDILDTDRSGVISTDEIMQKYDFTQDPDVRSGKKTIQQAAKDFMLHWERGSIDGVITYEEFEDYYKDISASIDDDDYFELMMRNSWRIAGGTGMAANTANRRLLVTKADGSQSVETVENELGLRGKDVDGMRSRLKQQGIDAAKIDLYGYQDATSKPKAAAAGPLHVGRGSNLNTRPSSASMPRPPARGSTASNSRLMPPPPPSMATANPWSILQRLLYFPPVALEQLCNKLQVSLAANAPRMAMGAFKSRISALDSSLDKNTVNEVWRMIDASNSGSVEVTKLYEMLVERFGKDKATTKSSTNVIERAKAKILERCGGQAGIKGLTRYFCMVYPLSCSLEHMLYL
jgi:calcyphosin